MANHRAACLHGYAGPEALVGRAWLELIEAGERARAMASLRMARDLMAGGTQHDTARRQDGTGVPMEVQLWRLCRQQGASNSMMEELWYVDTPTAKAEGMHRLQPGGSARAGAWYVRRSHRPGRK